MSLYLTLLILSIIFPLVLSFDRKVAFYRHWPALFPSLVVTGALFIIFDIYFARQGIWGFNPRYHSGIVIADLPLEEWLFFIVIPYASIFIHYVIIAYFPKAFFSDRTSIIITVVLISVLILGVIVHLQEAYTLVYFSAMIIVLSVAALANTDLLKKFYMTFLVILIPFSIINGILTGSFIADEVVWYNRLEITGLRIFTIPVEDFTYSFSLILINLLLMNYFRKLFNKNPDN
jgi:lycopene cyclase domain-containing protein